MNYMLRYQCFQCNRTQDVDFYLSLCREDILTVCLVSDHLYIWHVQYRIPVIQYLLHKYQLVDHSYGQLQLTLSQDSFEFLLENHVEISQKHFLRYFGRNR